MSRSRVLLLLAFLLSSIIHAAFADVAVDVRTGANLAPQAGEASYVVAIDDCTALEAIEVVAGSFNRTFALSETSRIDGSATGCLLAFEASGDGFLEPEVTLRFIGGATHVQPLLIRA